MRGLLPEVRDAFAAREREGAGIKGEIVLVIDGPKRGRGRRRRAGRRSRSRDRAAELKAAGVRNRIARAIAEEFGIARNGIRHISLEA